MTAIFATIKRLFSSNKICFIITAVVVLCATTSGDSKIAISNGNYTWLLAIMTPFLFVFYNEKKLMYLGTSKKCYYLGCLASYGLLAMVISIANIAIYSFVDPLNRTQTVINMIELCGWTTNGVPIAFLQQTLFLLLIMLFLHALLSMQPYWYGWVTDGLLLAILCIFIPIAPLRQFLASFFNIIMMNSNALLHMGSCLVLSAALSFVGLIVLKRKTF